MRSGNGRWRLCFRFAGLSFVARTSMDALHPGVCQHRFSRLFVAAFPVALTGLGGAIVPRIRVAGRSYGSLPPERADLRVVPPGPLETVTRRPGASILKYAPGDKPRGVFARFWPNVKAA